MKPFIAPFAGGKSSTSKHEPLYRNILTPIDVLIEPFAGMSNVSLNVSPILKGFELNDIDHGITSIYKCMKHKELYTVLRNAVENLSKEGVTKKQFYTFKNMEFDNVIYSALRKLVILNCSFSSASGGYSYTKAERPWGTGAKLKKLDKAQRIVQEKLRTDMKPKNWTIFLSEMMDKYEDCEEDVLFYIDPPYHKVSKQHNLYIENDVSLDLLFSSLRTLDYRGFFFIMSNAYDQEVVERANSHGFDMLRYSTRADMSKNSSYTELLISNMELKK